MDFFILDSEFKRDRALEGYISALWTERYSKSGDFELVFTEKEFESKGLDEGDYIGELNSIHQGIVDTIVYKDGRVTVKGDFLEKFLENRMFKGSSFDKSYNVNASPEIAMFTLVFYYCGDGMALGNTLGVSTYLKEKFTSLDAGSGASTYPTTPTYDFSISVPSNIYDELVKIAEAQSVGWRLYVDQTSPTYLLKWRPYRGSDRSVEQTTREHVVFSMDTESLKNVTEVYSIKGYKTAVHTYAPNLDPSEYSYNPADIVGFATAPGTSGYTDFKRRTLMVACEDLTPEDYHWWNSASDNGILKAWGVLNQRAKDILANNNYIKAVDGEVVQASKHIYGKDYFMGDIVTLKGSKGAYQNARIVEYIRSEDASGYKAYPTITVI